MSVTVMCELRPRREYAAAIIQQSMHQLSLPAGRVAGRRFARLYQHAEDPCWLLYVAEWESPDAFEAYRRDVPGPGRPEQFMVVPECRTYRRLTHFERMMTPSHVTHAHIVDGPAETHAQRRTLVVAYHRASAHDRAHLVQLSTYEADDAPSGLLLLIGWVAGPLGPSLDHVREADLIQHLVETGATVQRFVGQPIVENLGENGPASRTI